MAYLNSIARKSIDGEDEILPVYDCAEHGLWRLDIDGVFRLHPASIH